jgi:S1-C subfamily serine protease
MSIQTSCPHCGKTYLLKDAPARLLPLLLLIGGVMFAVLLLSGMGGVALWLFLREMGPPAPGGMALAEGPPPKDLEEARRVENHPTAKGLEELKAATVYVKVTAGTLRPSSGSGFVIRVEGNTGYIVTNEHVVNPREPIGSRGRRGGQPQPQPQPREAASPPEVTLVFWSGTRQEQSCRAEVVAADPEQDLAVLKVTEFANLPRPLDIGGPTKLTETLPVIVFGFPFGAALVGNVGNPSITVSQGSISSIRRNDRDEVAAVQIDGALNPGNSGGPVVDAEGRLVGIAVAIFRGANNIGFAVPGGELTKMLHGRIGPLRTATKATSGEKAEIEVVVPLIDPLKRIEAVTVHYLRSDDLGKDNPQPDQAGNLLELPGAQHLALRRDGQRAVGTFLVPVADKDKQFTFQTSYTTGTGQLIYTLPRRQALAPSGQPVVGRPPNR